MFVKSLPVTPNYLFCNVFFTILCAKMSRVTWALKRVFFEIAGVVAKISLSLKPYHHYQI